MPIISQIGRKSAGVRWLLGGIYLALILGSITMIYPFLIMVSGSTKSAVDVKEFDLIPRFLVDDAQLYRKHIEGLFDESVEMMRDTYDVDTPAFDKFDLPAFSDLALVPLWTNFLESGIVPDYAFTCGYLSAPISKTIPLALREFKTELAEEYGYRIGGVNQALGTDFVGWNAFFVLPENYLSRVRMPQKNAFADALRHFKNKQPAGLRFCLSPEAFFKREYLRARYGRSIDAYNKAHGTHYADYREVRLSRRAPEESLARSDWEDFVRKDLNLLWIRADQKALKPYRRFLKAKYGKIDILNRNYGTSYRRFKDIPLVDEVRFEGLALSDWGLFISGWEDPDTGKVHAAPLETLKLHSIDFLFRDYLAQKFKDITSMNKMLGTSYPSFSAIVPPQRAAHFEWFMANRRALRWEFSTRNYKTVTDYIVFHGRGVLNTAVYCFLAVFFALLINPLAAYAMSRYKMPSAYKVLLFLMLTMAFPAMVTQIPVFLMLRKLNLLNTFAALILPGLANGYSIFLLKGFFDSLPRELYENAALDGANEWTMFWNITMTLSTPILSVIALQAFTIAYSNFMYALLICQDEKMWTLMVWLYQLQGRSGPAVMYASLLLAAIPTFVIFILCQKVILRGIVVPVEK